MITFHFHLQPQYKYELFHINFTLTYSINTSEIPDEPLPVHMLFHMWKDHHCYGYIIRWQSLAIFGKCSETDKSWEIFGKVFGNLQKIVKKLSLLCLYSKQNSTWLLVDMKFLFTCSTSYREMSSWTLQEKFHIYSHPCIIILYVLIFSCGRRGDLISSALDLWVSGPGLSPGQGHCVVFLCRTLNSLSASLDPGV